MQFSLDLLPYKAKIGDIAYLLHFIALKRSIIILQSKIFVLLRQKSTLTIHYIHKGA